MSCLCLGHHPQTKRKQAAAALCQVSSVSFRNFPVQVEQLRRRMAEQAAQIERLRAARLTAEAALAAARDEVDSLHAALRCACCHKQGSACR